MAMNHGCSLAFYIDDPEGNMIEIYWSTGLDNRQPHGNPLDLNRSDVDLMQELKAIATRAGLAPPPALVAMGNP